MENGFKSLRDTISEPYYNWCLSHSIHPRNRTQRHRAWLHISITQTLLDGLNPQTEKIHFFSRFTSFGFTYLSHLCTILKSHCICVPKMHEVEDKLLKQIPLTSTYVIRNSRWTSLRIKFTCSGGEIFAILKDRTSDVMSS